MKVNDYRDSLKSIPTYKENDTLKKNLLLEKSRILWDKLSMGSIVQKKKRQFAIIIKKLTNLNLFKKETHDNRLGEIEYYVIWTFKTFRINTFWLEEEYVIRTFILITKRIVYSNFRIV